MEEASPVIGYVSDGTVTVLSFGSRGFCERGRQ